MRKPGTDESNVQMSDVLCDFCRREWTEDVPMIEGHHGSCICGNCLSVAFTELVINVTPTAPPDFACTMCLERPEDRAAQNRTDEPGWVSPTHDDAFACRRCIKLAVGTLHKDPAWDWRKPESP